jgi:hypothetical protein
MFNMAAINYRGRINNTYFSNNGIKLEALAN